jgi:hypothetical protein
MNDPHASLSLFQPREIHEEEPVHNSQPTAPRALSAKPPPREYSELFVGEDAASPSPSPQKVPAKAGSGKNFSTNRLFEQFDDFSAESAPGNIKTNSKKYDHFTFGEGDDTPKAHNTANPTKHDQNRNRNDAHWDFDDFATPEKTKSKTHPQAVRHFGWSDDEVSPSCQFIACLLTYIYCRRNLLCVARLSTRLAQTPMHTSISTTKARQKDSGRKHPQRAGAQTRARAYMRITSLPLPTTIKIKYVLP